MENLKNPQSGLCYYANYTNHIQILKVKKTEKIFWERVVFPQERLFFYAQYSDELEIYEKMANHLAKIENIACEYLLVSEAPVGHDFLVNSSFG
ncbi:MAG: hypothetical protein Fur0025_04950 [Oscillatoriaceae cyanobacterium]